MKFDSRKVAGALLFVGGVQWFLVIVIAEGLHPGYNSGLHYVSSLGVGATSPFYNPSVFLLGVTIVAGAYLIQRAFGSRLFFVLFAITGFATMGVGLFPEDVRPMHGIVTPIALLFGGLSAIMSYKLQKPPLSYASVLLGALSLVASALFYPYLGLPRESSTTYLGLGKGTMERMVIYPILLWAIGFGSHLTGQRAVASSGARGMDQARNINRSKYSIDRFDDDNAGVEADNRREIGEDDYPTMAEILDVTA